MDRLTAPQLSTSTVADDRRKHPRRLATHTTGKLYTPGDKDRLPAKSVQMINLSLCGTSFRATEPLVVGQMFGLDIKGNWMTLSSRIRLVSCRAREGGEFEVGAKFC